MKIPLTDLYRQYQSIKSEIDAAIENVIRDSAFIKGSYVSSFEENFARTIGVSKALGLGNGTDALFIALKALGVKEGDEVITAANSFIASSEAISLCGAKPVFADCDDYYVIDPADLARKITKATKAIIPVHLYGQSANMNEIMKIAKENGLKVVEDTAQAVLAEYKGKMCGSFGDCATFSFYPGKNLGANGDGGALVSNNTDLYNWAVMFANHGRVDKYDHRFEGINSRLDGIQAAILDVKLKHLARWTEQRRQVAAWYNERLSDLNDIILPKERKGAKHVYHIFPIRTEAALRDKLLDYLKGEGIGALVHYPIALPNLTAYKYLGYKESDYPNASKYSKELISLPIFPELKEDEVDYVAEKIKAFFKSL